MGFHLLEANDLNILLSAQNLIKGNLVAIPTETVYGLAADAMNMTAVERIYKIKSRPISHPLIVHISDIETMNFWAIDIPTYAKKLALRYWPGPMTLIFRASKNVGSWLTGGQKSIALRIPRHPVTAELLLKFKELGGLGLAAPSANKFGGVSPTSAQDVLQDFKNKTDMSDFVLDGGTCEIGIESTIIDFQDNIPKILRPGAISLDMISEEIEVDLLTLKSKEKKLMTKVPGSFSSHYSPKAKVLISELGFKGDGFLGLVNIDTPEGFERLAAPTNVEDFARILYSAFRKADDLALERIVVIPPEGDGLAEAIRDRIYRAAGSP